MKIIAPAFLGGGFFKPPPPPRADNRESRDDYPKSNNFPQRERKNTIYLKNIPNNLNKFDKLMTFFKDFGSIKNIKTSE